MDSVSPTEPFRMETSDTQPSIATPSPGAPVEPGEDAAPTRGASRSERTRRRNRRGIGIAAVVVAVGIAVGAAAASVRHDDSTASNASPPPSTASTGVKDATAQQPKHRTLSVDDPMRLWIGGDSLAGSLGPSLGQLTAATGVVAPRFDSRVSSGLTSPTFFDWPKHATEEMAKRDPEAVVFIIGTNDANTMPDLASAQDAAAITAQYATQVEQMMQILIGDDHRPVYWVATPPMKDRHLNANVVVLNGVIAGVAAKHPEVTFIDVSAELSDSHGAFTTTATDGDGKTVTLRADDGIHLTPDGGDRMAAPVYAAIDAAWHLTAQAVPGHVQPVVQTEGSSQIPGTGRNQSGSSGNSGTRSASGSGGTTSTTSAPVEAPPETTPSTEPPSSTTVPSSSTTAPTTPGPPTPPTP